MSNRRRPVGGTCSRWGTHLQKCTQCTLRATRQVVSCLSVTASFCCRASRRCTGRRTSELPVRIQRSGAAYAHDALRQLRNKAAIAPASLPLVDQSWPSPAHRRSQNSSERVTTRWKRRMVCPSAGMLTVQRRISPASRRRLRSTRAADLPIQRKPSCIRTSRLTGSAFLGRGDRLLFAHQRLECVESASEV